MQKRMKILGVILIVLYLIPGIPSPLGYLAGYASVDAYLDKYYADEDLEIDRFGYSFTYGCYSARIISPFSEDVRFNVYTSEWIGVRWDTYSDVVDGSNTAGRISNEYASAVNSIFDEDMSESGEGHVSGWIEYAKREWISDENETDPDYPYYSLVQDELIPDGEYDARALGRKHGSLHIDFREENISYRRAAEILLQVKEKMDEEEIGFYVATLSLKVPPSGEYGEARAEDATIFVMNFPYADIYPEDLPKRIEKEYKTLMEYYKEPITYTGEE